MKIWVGWERARSDPGFLIHGPGTKENILENILELADEQLSELLPQPGECMVIKVYRDKYDYDEPIEYKEV